jgi:hypothetical protein
MYGEERWPRKKVMAFHKAQCAQSKVLSLWIKIKLFILSWHYHITNIYSCLLNSGIRSDRRNQALRALDSEKHVKNLIDSGQFREEDEKGIGVPYFDLESILAATDSFSNANKLGEGGYGPVYKVISITLIAI